MAYLWLGLLFTLSVWSQDQDRPASSIQTFGTLENMVQNFKPVETKEEKEAAYNEKQRKKVQTYFDNLLSSSQLGPNTREDESTKFIKTELRRCVSAKLKNGVDAKAISSLTSDCKPMWKELTDEHLDYLRDKGVQPPDDFVSFLEADLRKKEEELKVLGQEEAVVEIRDLIKMDELTSEKLHHLQTFDPKINTLLSDVSEVIVKMHNSEKISTLLSEVESKGDFEGRNELLLFAEFLQKAQDPKDPCWIDGSMTDTSDKASELFSGFSERAQIVLGLPKEIENPKDIKSYKYIVGGVTHYLFKAESEIPGENRWVLAQINEQGEMSFRSFKIQVDQNSKAKIHESEDITIFRTRLQKSSSDLPSGKFYIQSQEGLIIKTDEIDAPIIGPVLVPEAKLVIGRVHMAYVTNKTLTQTSVEVNHDALRMSMQVQPTKNSDWSVQAGIKYSPFNGHLQVGSSLRAQNFTVGYSLNQRGDSYGRVSYILNNNFISVDSNLKSTPNITLGRQFKNQKGFISASRDLHGVYEVQLILLLHK